MQVEAVDSQISNHLLRSRKDSERRGEVIGTGRN